MNIKQTLSWLMHKPQNIRMMCQVNYISENQAKAISKRDSPKFIRATLKSMQNEPDLDYLAKALMPKLVEGRMRKTIDARDVVKATILGDIIGSKYEFSVYDYSRMKTKTLPSVAARFTDDTVLSIATMNAILANEMSPDFATEYKKAYRMYPNAGYGSSFAAWARDDTKKTGYNSMANGSVMRISFIPAYYENVEYVIRYTIESAMTTHNHIEGVKGAVVMSVCIWMALHGYTKDEIWEYCKKHYLVIDKNLLLDKQHYFDVKIPLSEMNFEKNRNTLFCSFVVPYIVKAFHETSSYDECMRQFLSHFGDSDTMCAVAGGLCYAFYGETGYDVDNILSNYSVPI